MLNLIFRVCILVIIVQISTAQAQCMPTNWNYPWFKVGKAWFTKTDVARTLLEQISECKKIEAKSTIGTVRTKDESTKVSLRFKGFIWLGAFEIGSTGKWFWWNAVRGAPEPINHFYWDHGEPDNRGGEACLVAGGTSGRWLDYSCSSKFKALCEIRCG